MHITRKYLNEHPECIFVFGDNNERRGYGGAAILRDHPQTYGFITKKAPGTNDEAYYKPDEYHHVLGRQLEALAAEAIKHPDKIYLVSKVGSGLANKYNIWEMIEPRLRMLAKRYNNIRLLFE